jgi:hypothetical protein
MNNHAKRDWHEYNQKLINRGSLTFWLDQNCLNSWINKCGKKGRPSFSNLVIQAGCRFKSIYRLSLRSLQGFLDSILKISQSNPEFGINEFIRLSPSDKIKVINLNFAFFSQELFSQLLPKTQANIIDAVDYEWKLVLFDSVSDNEKKSDIIGNLMNLGTGTTNSTISALIRERPNCFENYPPDSFKQSLFNLLSQDVQGILIKTNPYNKQYLPESDRRQ